MSPSAPKRNLYKIGFFILLVVNLAWVLWVMALDRRPPGRQRGPRSEAHVERMMGRRLGLDEAQQREFRALYAAHHQKMEAMQQEIGRQKEALFELMEARDSLAADSLLSHLGESEARMQRMIFEHLQEVRAILKPAQQEKFSRLMRRGMGPEHERPHGKHKH